MASDSQLWLFSVIAARSAVVLLILTIGLRLMGKRQSGQMNVYDAALILLIANAVQNAMTHGDGNLIVGFASAGALMLVGRLFTGAFVRLPKLRDYLIGTPTVLVSDGHLILANMKREHVTKEQLCTALREHSMKDFREVKLAILEVDGTISVVGTEEHSERTPRYFRALRLP